MNYIQGAIVYFCNIIFTHYTWYYIASFRSGRYHMLSINLLQLKCKYYVSDMSELERDWLLQEFVAAVNAARARPLTSVC